MMRTMSAAFALSLAACSHACSHSPPPPPPAATATNATALPPASPSAPLTVSSTAEVAVGKPPPDFSAKAHDGTDVHLAALKGKPVVVYFYPKDETPGCTKEACAFRDAWSDLQKKGVVLIGVSSDTDDSHRAFAEHHKLPFLLVSDPKGDLCKAYGVPFDRGYAGRQSFLIGADGNVKNVYRQVDVTTHAQQLAGDIGP